MTLKSNLHNRILAIFALIASLTVLPNTANAQLYEIANRIPSLISPALSGSMNYKGLAELGYSKTVGNYDADFLEVSTSQGFMYSNWFYMGVGIGADILFSNPKDNWGSSWNPETSFDTNHSHTTTAVMLPLFTDFRFTLGQPQNANFFIGVKLGCSFLLSDDYIKIGDGYLTNREYFYLRPSLGIRLPVNSKKPKQAVDISLNYKLLTSNYWYNRNHNVTLNGFGASIAYEW